MVEAAVPNKVPIGIPIIRITYQIDAKREKLVSIFPQLRIRATSYLELLVLVLAGPILVSTQQRDLNNSLSRLLQEQA